jgi:sigma-B regulation protein RsbU (phosphoserine phosphatase)
MGAEVRLWRVSDGKLQLVAGKALPEGVSTPPAPSPDQADDQVRAVPGAPDYFFQFEGSQGRATLGSLLARLLDGERDAMQIAEELSHRYEEIDLLYTISEVLGRALSLQEAAQVIVREVSAVVGARRASILVHDPSNATLQVVAGWGIDVSDFAAVPIDDPTSIAASVFRRGEAVFGNASDTSGRSNANAANRAYRGDAYMSVPIVYPDSNGNQRTVGVINLTDRMGQDAFDDAHAKLVNAVAHQIGAAVENARLVALDQQRQRVRHEMELAHDLQLRLLAAPRQLEADVDVGARFRPAESVGGDFYQFVPLPGSHVGVMLGDVSSHGFSSALIMALVLSAAAIHAVAATSPEVALERLLASVKSDLAEAEMHVALFYGVADTANGRLRYANAGHPHAFRVPQDGPPERLDATVPPLGLGDGDQMLGGEVAWQSESDLLLLFSDGISEARNEAGEQFGESRVIDVVRATSTQSAERVVAAVFAEVDLFSQTRSDDQTVVVLKA